jgi:2-methylcitrate dehydratase PrpD
MITLDLIHNVLDVRYSDFSAQVIQDAKNQILDLVATMVGGADASGNHVLLELVRQWGGQGRQLYLVMVTRFPYRTQP